MKVSFAPVLVVATLSVMPGVASSQTSQSPPNADPQMSQSTSASPPAMTEPSMNRYDYDATGTQPGGSSGSGRGRDGGRCVVGLSCDIYRGS